MNIGRKNLTIIFFVLAAAFSGFYMFIIGMGSASPGCTFEHIAMTGFPRRIQMISGPATQAYGEIYHAAWGLNGEIFFVSEHHMGIFVIDDGVVSRVAGMDRRGYRDGPAELALFDARANGYHWSDIALDSAGNIFMTDGGNKVIRRISNETGRWMVSTFVGGGAIKPTLGDSYQATDIDLSEKVCSIAIDSNDNIWTNPGSRLIKITPSGNATFVYETEYMNSQIMIADQNDVIWGIEGGAGKMWKYSELDGFEWVITKNRNFDGGTYDGPIANASTASDSHIATIDGSVVYFGGNDAAGNLRKIEDEGGGLWVKSLMPDDTWQELTFGQRSQGKDCGAPTLIDDAGAIYLTHSQYSTDTTRFRKMTCDWE